MKAEEQRELPVSRIGRYDIVGQLATGGMAEILLGRLSGPSGFEQLCVVKRILPHLARKPNFIGMFVDEARLVANIRHPNVVAVQELANDAGELFLVMEYLAGESLGGLTRRLFSRGEQLAPAIAAFVVAEACAGLHAAHELRDGDGFMQNVVHRDVSPQNIFVTYAGQVKVLDFGVAKAEKRIAETEAGQIKGKFAYMSPEQCLGKFLDRRSDVFALGIVLWELLAGRCLFKRSSEHLTFKAICEEPVPSPGEFLASIPQSLAKVTMKALKRRRDDRYQTAQELRRDLLALARQLGLSDTPEEELASVMSRAFADRVEQKQEMLRRFQAGSATTQIPVAEIDDDVDLPSVVDELATPPATAQSARRPARRRFSALIVVAIGAAGTAWLLHSGTETANDVAIPSATANPSLATSTQPLPSATAPAKKTVLLRIDTAPSGARVRIDKRDRGVTPLELKVDHSHVAMRVGLSRVGFAPRNETVVPNMSQRLVLPLTPLPRSKPKSTQEIPRFR